MAHRCAYLVKTHSVSNELVVNFEITGIHVVSTGGSRIWEAKTQIM